MKLSTQAYNFYIKLHFITSHYMKSTQPLYQMTCLKKVNNNNNNNNVYISR